MRYRRGEFITVPNKEVLRGLPPGSQCVYLWICAYADRNGVCYPSKATLAKEAGISERQVHRSLKLLESAGILKITARHDGKRQTSNLYTIVMTNRHGEDAAEATQSVSVGHGEDATKADESNPSNINPVEQNNNSSSTPPLAKEGPAAQDINQVIGLFAMVNEAYKNLFPRSVERKAAEHLLARHTIDEIRTMVEYVRDHRSEDYFPSVLKPSQLEEKWSGLQTRRNKRAASSSPLDQSREELKDPKYGKVHKL